MANFTLADVRQIAERLPNLKILVNHLTGLTITGEPAKADWAAEVKATAAHANVSCKVSGIFQRSGRMPAPRRWPITRRSSRWCTRRLARIAYLRQ